MTLVAPWGSAAALASGGGRQPQLREIVAEVSAALALLDASRLQELAVVCERLGLDHQPMTAAETADLARQAREAAQGMEVLAHVLEATRANLTVMNRLRDLREGRLEYVRPHPPLTEKTHGND